MANSAQFAYTTLTDSQGISLIRPLVPIRLLYAGRIIASDALLDTGADVNVLPYTLGQQLGLNWDEARPVDGLSGNLGKAEARAVILDALVGSFNPSRLLFIWVKTDAARLLLGQINFFQRFDVCFFGSDSRFEIFPRE